MRDVWTRLAVAVWVLFAVVLALHAFFFPQAHNVYQIYAPASRNWWTGRDMYARPGDCYRYSPLFAVALTPVAALPDSLGSALWKALNVTVYGVGLGAWARRVTPVLGRNEKAVLFLLVIPGSMDSMYNGQANLVMLGSALLGLADAAGRRWNRAAGWMALATLIKGYPLALALLLSALYPRRFAPRFAAALSIGLIFPFAVQRPDYVWSQYESWAAHLTESTVILRERHRSIDHLLEICGHPITPQAYILLGAIAGLAVFGLWMLRIRRTRDRRERLTWAFLLYSGWVVLFGPATESCTYAVAAPAVAWLLIEAFRKKSAWLARGTLLASLILMGPLVTDLFGTTIRNFANEHGSQPLGALVLCLYLLVRSTQGLVRCDRAVTPTAVLDQRSVSP